MMRSEFLKGMQAVPPVEPEWKKFTLEVPSEARFEDYNWMTPSPGITPYAGHRSYAALDSTQYIVQNREFQAGIQVPLRNIRDDKTGGYAIRFQELGQKANIFPGRYVLQNMALGTTTTCFDGTNFFNKTHNQGGGTAGSGFPAPSGGIGFDQTNSGLNLIKFTAASGDALTYQCCFMMHYGMLKPMGYQNRMQPELGTNAGTPESQESKMVRYWIDLEGNAFYGYWWDAILLQITNTPTLTEIFTMLDQVIKQFRSFTLPQAQTNDPPLYVHQEVRFNPGVATAVCSTGLEMILSHALGDDQYAVSTTSSMGVFSTNLYKGKFGLISSGYLNSAAGT